MTMLLDGRLRDLATQTHLLETKVSSLGLDGRRRRADEAALKRARRALRRYPNLSKGQRREMAETAVMAAYGMEWEER